MPVDSVNGKRELLCNTRGERACEDYAVLEVQLGWGCTEKRNIVPCAICWTVILPLCAWKCLTLDLSVSMSVSSASAKQGNTRPLWFFNLDICICMCLSGAFSETLLLTCGHDLDWPVCTCWCMAVTCSSVHTLRGRWGEVLRKENYNAVPRFSWMSCQEIIFNETFWIQFKPPVV